MTPRALGTDLIHVDRVRSVLDRHGERFKSRCFTPAEQADCERSGPDRAAEKYAARFAAKESAAKALGTGIAEGITWRDVAVATDASGAPSLRVTGAAGARAEQLGITAWLCSLSHTDEMAMATVIGLG